MASEKYNWPIYKGPVKRPGFAKSLYEDPFSIKRHAKTSVPKHAGNDTAYQLYLKHHPIQARHAKPNYRYTQDGRIRKVLPKQAKQEAIKQIREVKHQGPIESPPPRMMVLHKYNDRYEPSFSLAEYRSLRPAQTWFMRFRMCNYFKELLLVDVILIILSFSFLIQEDDRIEQFGRWMFVGSLVLCPILMICVIAHQFHKAGK